MTQITFSTRQAARYLGCEAHVLHSNWRRHGNYRHIVPRKGSGGRLAWPADEVREAALPPTWQQPEGMSLWLDIVARICPGVEPKDTYRIGVWLLGSEACAGWHPLLTQTSESTVRQDLPLAMMILQAVLDRVDSAGGVGVRDSFLSEFAALLAARLRLTLTSGDVDATGVAR